MAKLTELITPILLALWGKYDSGTRLYLSWVLVTAPSICKNRAISTQPFCDLACGWPAYKQAICSGVRPLQANTSRPR